MGYAVSLTSLASFSESWKIVIYHQLILNHILKLPFFYNTSYKRSYTYNKRLKKVGIIINVITIRGRVETPLNLAYQLTNSCLL
jgi:hypothetical protein